MSRTSDPQPTCAGCGVCCEKQGLPPGYTVAALMTHLPEGLRDEVLEHLAEERRVGATRNERGLPCIWYDAKTKGCAQYEYRTPVCRKLEAASDGCNQWRSSRSLPIFVVERPTALVYTPEPEEGESWYSPTMSSALTAEQRARFHEDGFLVVPDFVPEAECDTLIERARALVDAFEPSTISIFSTNEQTRTSDDHFLGSGDDVRFFFEEEAFLPDGKLRQAKAHSINKIGHALHTRDPIFTRFSQQRALADVVSSLDLRAPVALQSMYIFKNPFIGGDVACHQDATFLYTDPVSVVGLWFALEDATLENGCLWALPGGHREPLRKRFVRAEGGGTAFVQLDGTPLPDVTTAAPWVPLEAKKGTMVLLHGLLPHFSCANRSPRSRHAYSIHYVDDACRYPTDNWLLRA